MGISRFSRESRKYQASEITGSRIEQPLAHKEYWAATRAIAGEHNCFTYLNKREETNMILQIYRLGEKGQKICGLESLAVEVLSEREKPVGQHCRTL